MRRCSPGEHPATFAWSSSGAEVDTWLVDAAFEQGQPNPGRRHGPRVDADRTDLERVQGSLVGASSARGRVGRSGSSTEDGLGRRCGHAHDVEGSRGCSLVLPGGAAAIHSGSQGSGSDPLAVRDDRFSSQPRSFWTSSGLRELPFLLERWPRARHGRRLRQRQGSYVLTETAREVVLDRSKVISWSEIRRQDKQPTFGLLSQVSPDGRFAVSTVKDRSCSSRSRTYSSRSCSSRSKGSSPSTIARRATSRRCPCGRPSLRPEQSRLEPRWQRDRLREGQGLRPEVHQGHGHGSAHPGGMPGVPAGGKTFRFDLYRIPFNGGRGARRLR